LRDCSLRWLLRHGLPLGGCSRAFGELEYREIFTS
jgi:hypothetical protein